MTPKPPKVKKGEPPAVDKLIKPAIGIGLALLAYQFIKGLQTEIRRVNVFDSVELNDVFTGDVTGNSYAVLCQDEDSSHISSVFQDAFTDKTHTAEFRLLDCSFVLPDDGKTVAERYKLDVKKRPTIFLSGKSVESPVQVNSKHLKTGKHLVNFIRSKLEKRAAKIETTQDLRSKCLDKDICGLLLKGSKKAPQYIKDAMDKVLKEFPNISFASVDSSLLYVYNLEEYLPELNNDQPRFVVFQKVSGSTQAGKDRLKTSFASTKDHGVSYGHMSNLIAEVVTSKAEMQTLTSLPIIKTRSKKLVEEERLKRQRRRDQKIRQERGESVDETPPGYFQPNDGSKDGRRAERERRRAEHRDKNNVREKTKEEIAEMERRRRERMDEEAAKWNAVPEDAPPEGDFYDEDISDETIVIDDDVQDDDQDDENVIDLD